MDGQQSLLDLSYPTQPELSLHWWVDKGYDVYLDRFYNSPLIATELKRKGITVTGISMPTSCTLYLLLVISRHGPEQLQRTSFCPEPKEASRYGGSLSL